MAEHEICGRFAPTPSGRMHIGNVFCALLAWLSARAAGGRMLLRIEDIDFDRCPEGGSGLLEQDLFWLGLDWDEGGSRGGPRGPYYQRLRREIYAEYYELLREKGLLYPCFCSRAQLHPINAPHLSDGRYIYSGHCREMPPEEQARRAARRSPAMRLCVPGETIAFCDGVQGEYAERLASDCGDFIVRRADGIFPYQLAVVVDDALMGVTEVVRGRDLLSSTPRQLYLFRLLEFAPPRYFHLPMVLAGDGRRLSKRDGDLDFGLLRERFSPAELTGRLAFLAGLLDRPEPVTAKELISTFSWDRVPKGDLLLPEGLFER